MIIKQMEDIGLGLWCLTPLSRIFFSYIVAASYISGENHQPDTSH